MRLAIESVCLLGQGKAEARTPAGQGEKSNSLKGKKKKDCKREE